MRVGPPRSSVLRRGACGPGSRPKRAAAAPASEKKAGATSRSKKAKEAADAPYYIRVRTGEDTDKPRKWSNWTVTASSKKEAKASALANLAGVWGEDSAAAFETRCLESAASGGPFAGDGGSGSSSLIQEAMNDAYKSIVVMAQAEFDAWVASTLTVIPRAGAAA